MHSFSELSFSELPKEEQNRLLRADLPRPTVQPLVLVNKDGYEVQAVYIAIGGGAAVLSMREATELAMMFEEVTAALVKISPWRDGSDPARGGSKVCLKCLAVGCTGRCA